MTLKYMNADEIASSMMDVLGDNDFQAIHKKASFKKTADDEDSLLEAVEDFDAEEGFEEIDNEDLEIEEPMGELDFEAEIWGEDETDEEIEEEIEEEIKKYDKGELDWQQDQIRGEMMDDMRGDSEDWAEARELADKFDLETEAALKITKLNLVKMANALDVKGFAGIASVIDQTIVRLSAKGGSCLSKFKTELKGAKTANDARKIYNKHLDDLKQENCVDAAIKAREAVIKKLDPKAAIGNTPR